ncbi:MAG: hypothetical protein A3F72_21605 [Bacteroidetes bacterium RIFCSPLOWO2_12_FULL_35_15]|nr:MAG: hypothetical protein A3F72_21605 [Bacteroidetes bacterium RIFCSPLOWO2_12_FULL_35_15]
MKVRSLGVLIIIIGIMMMIYSGFNYISNEKVIDLGSVKVIREINHPVQWSPFLGVILIIAGTVLIVTDKKIHT